MTTSFPQWLAFAAFLFLAMSLPGPGVFATIGRSIRFGRKKTGRFIVGACLGDLSFLWIALLGLDSLVKTNSFLFTVLSCLLGIYFILTGMGEFTQSTKKNVAATAVENEVVHDGKLFMEGFLLTLSNPKVVFFYLGLLPSLLEVATLTRIDYLVVSILTPAMLFLVLSVYATVAERARDWLASRSVGQIVRALSGAIMVAIGLLLVFKSGVTGLAV